VIIIFYTLHPRNYMCNKYREYQCAVEVCDLILTPSLAPSLTAAVTSFHRCLWGIGLFCSAFYFCLLSDAPPITTEELQHFECLLCYTNSEWFLHVPQ
jgi:hypothetical protein